MLPIITNALQLQQSCIFFLIFPDHPVPACCPQISFFLLLIVLITLKIGKLSKVNHQNILLAITENIQMLQPNIFLKKWYF